MSSLLRELAKEIRKRPEERLEVRQATVSALNIAARTATITLAGSATSTTATYLFQPSLNATVQVLIDSGDVVIIGQVGGNQQAAVANPTGGTVIDVEARAQLNLVLNRLRIYGIIAP